MNGALLTVTDIAGFTQKIRIRRDTPEWFRGVTPEIDRTTEAINGTEDEGHRIGLTVARSDLQSEVGEHIFTKESQRGYLNRLKCHR
jgi:hypothetical protein